MTHIGIHSVCLSLVFTNLLFIDQLPRGKQRKRVPQRSNLEPGDLPGWRMRRLWVQLWPPDVAYCRGSRVLFSGRAESRGES